MYMERARNVARPFIERLKKQDKIRRHPALLSFYIHLVSTP